MNLLASDPPEAVWLVGDALMWDTEADGDADAVYDIAISYRSILAIFDMLEDRGLSEREKAVCLLRMFYLDNLPDDVDTALELAIEFMAYGKGTVDARKPEPQSYSWTQDGDYIYAAVNQSFNGILDAEPDLHWWRFVNCFMNINEDCRINDIICNRAAHRKGKASKEQKEARRQYPEIYILHRERTTDNETMNRAKELEKLMNA